VEAGSNTSTVTLRVVGGDEKGSLKSGTVKYGRKSQGTRTRERLRWQGPAAYTIDRPVFSSERAPHGIKNVTVRRIPYGNKNLVVSPGWVLYTKTDWSGHVGFVVNKVALGQVFSEYFGFPCQFSFHRLLHIHHHLSSGAGTTGQLVADVPSGLSLTPPQETKKKKSVVFLYPSRRIPE
jgi:hypothetical protein